MLKKIFAHSIERIDSFYDKHIFCLLGFKMSYRKPNMEALNYRLNCNLVNSIFNNINTADEKDLFCLKNNRICFIFNKNILKFGYTNFCDFILNCYCSLITLLSYEKLDYDSEIYKEHITRTANNEFIWKYAIRNNSITYKFLQFDDTNQIYINEKCLFEECLTDKKNCSLFYKTKDSKRLFIPGTSIRQYLLKESREKKIQTLIKLIDWITETYSVKNGKINGTMFDCTCNNFIIDRSGNFHFIDDEFISLKPITKEYVIRTLMRDADTPDKQEILSYLLKYYGMSKTDKLKIDSYDKKQRMKLEYFKF